MQNTSQAPMEKLALALSDPLRLRILDFLASGREEACCSPENPDNPRAVCSCDLQPVLDLSPSRLSYHLKELKSAGLIVESRRGRWIYYSLARESVAAFASALLDRYVSNR